MRSSILVRWAAAAASHRGYSSLSGKSSAPWLMLAPWRGYNYFYSVGEEKVIRLKQGAQEEGALLVGSSHGWVALYKEHERLVFLSNPITGEQVKLPPLPPGRRVAKVILTSPHPHDHECRAAMTFHNGSLSLCAPAAARSTVDWTSPVSDDPFPTSYADFVYSHKKAQLLCLLDHPVHDLEGWDLTLSNPRMEWSENLHEFDPRYPLKDPARTECYSRRYSLIGCSRRRYLVHVDHTDQLLQVTRYFINQMTPDGSNYYWSRSRLPAKGFDLADMDNLIYPLKTLAFEVHVIDRRRRKRTYVKGSLAGLALFVGLNHSFAVPAAHSPGLQPDSIYFTDARAHPSNHDDDCEEVYTGHDIGIFDYKKAAISSCYYPCHFATLKKIHPSPLWFTPTPY